jgi:hypothetical protein
MRVGFLPEDADAVVSETSFLREKGNNCIRIGSSWTFMSYWKKGFCCYNKAFVTNVNVLWSLSPLQKCKGNNPRVEPQVHNPLVVNLSSFNWYGDRVDHRMCTKKKLNTAGVRELTASGRLNQLAYLSECQKDWTSWLQIWQADRHLFCSVWTWLPHSTGLHQAEQIELARVQTQWAIEASRDSATVAKTLFNIVVSAAEISWCRMRFGRPQL